jgi:cytosine/adenosine deaminase-related metal-dependent hydrolase
VSAIVYSAQPTDVEAVTVDGELVMENRKLLRFDEREVIDEANRESEQLLKRAGLN